MAIFTNRATLSYRNGTVISNVVTGEIVEVLSATKNALLDSYSQGDTVTYVIGLFNSGNTDLVGVTLTDDLGAYSFGTATAVPLTYIDGSVAYYLDGVLQPQPAVTAGANLTVNNITVPANGYAQIIYQARVNEFAPVAVGSEITNTVTATVGNESVTASETINVVNAPLLSISKALFPATVSENGRLSYTFTIQNFGNTAAVATDDLSITDTFDPILEQITVTYEGQTWTDGTEYNYNPTTGLFSTVPGNITVPAATYTQNPVTGEWDITPGSVTLTVTGTI